LNTIFVAVVGGVVFMNLFDRRYRIGAIIAVTGLPLAASAQVQPCACTISAACCQCADGTSKHVDLSTGVAPWRVSWASSGPPQQAVPAGLTAWTAALPGAAWVGPAGPPINHTPYTYTLNYAVPNCVIPGTTVITVQAAADDSASLVVPPGPGFSAAPHHTNPSAMPAPFTLPPSFTTPGPHTLTFMVHNSVGPTGLLLKATLTTKCPLQS
jgi:hypothetical protein